MKTIRIPALCLTAAAVLGVSAAARADVDERQVTPGAASAVNMDQRFMTQREASWVEFTVDVMGIATAKGWATVFGSTLFYDEDEVENSSATLYFNVDDMVFGSGKLDEPVKSPMFLDAARHPRVTFQSTRVVAREDGFDVVGDLTVRGVAREVTIRMESPSEILRDDQSGIDLVNFRGHLSFDRGEFGLTETTGTLRGRPRVGLRVDVNFSLTAFRYTEAYLERRFLHPGADGAVHPVGTLYETARRDGPAAALEHYAEMKVQTPTKVDKSTLPDLGWILMRNQRAADSIAVFQQSIEENPETWYTYLRMGDAYVISGNHEKAVELYTAMREHYDYHPHIEHLLRLLAE